MLARGSVVTVVVYGGAHVQKRVWQDVGNEVLLCSDAGYQRALESGEEPLYIGFPKSDVVDTAGTASGEG